MKKIIVMMALLTSTLAQAGYEAAARKLKMCESVGTVISLAPSAKEKGFSAETYSKEWGIEGNQRLIEIVQEVYEKGSSTQEAYMLGWSRCMDMLK